MKNNKQLKAPNSSTLLDEAQGLVKASDKTGGAPHIILATDIAALEQENVRVNGYTPGDPLSNDLEDDWDVPTLKAPSVKVSIDVLSPPQPPRDTLQLPAFRLRFMPPKGTGDDLRERIKSYNYTKHISTQPRRHHARLPFPRDGGLIATVIIACIASVLSLRYFFQQHQTLLYGDAYSHMLIARRLFDNLTPGLAQLGGVWLPLPHLVMLPFIWNDYLWQTGLAGSFVSMPCYIITSIYLFLGARRLTRSSRASFVGTLVFVLNPNILYLQTTPLSELVLLATMSAACYYFLAWAQTDHPTYLILAAAATFLATLSRYDGWALFMAILVLILIIGWIKRSRWPRIEGHLAIFGSLAGLGIILWFAWCGFIFGDPFYFQSGPFSAEAQQRDLINAHLLYTYHNLGQAIRYYTIDCIDTIGPILLVLAAFAVIVFLIQRRITPETLAALAYLVPIPYYMFSLYSGQASLYLPEAVPGYAPYLLFNARYGAMAVPPAALFIAFLASAVSLAPACSPTYRSFMQRARRALSQHLGPLVCAIIVIAQSILVVSGGIITLEDGQYGLACTPTHTIVIYLIQHYAGGKILEDLYTSKIDSLEPTAGIDFKNIVYEGSGTLWTKALSHPEWVVDWIIVNPDNAGDYVAKKLDLASPAFTSLFTFILQEPNGLTLYHRNGLPLLPRRPVPRSIYTVHSLCTTNNARQASKARPPVADNIAIADNPRTLQRVREGEQE